MAHPTQITIASGKTVYEGDESDGITSRQVQVSVTYQLERSDEDLLLAVERKAREVEAAHEAAWRQVRREQTELRMDGTEPALPPTEPTIRDEDEEDPGPPPDDEDCPEGGEDETGDWRDDGNDGRGMAAHGPACPSAVVGTELAVPGANAAWERPVTKPQRLALHAQARRLGLSDQALADEVRERFGKTSFMPRYAVERLTKDEADALLRALAEREWEVARPGQTAPV